MARKLKVGNCVRTTPRAQLYQRAVPAETGEIVGYSKAGIRGGKGMYVVAWHGFESKHYAEELRRISCRFR